MSPELLDGDVLHRLAPAFCVNTRSVASPSIAYFGGETIGRRMLIVRSGHVVLLQIAPQQARGLERATTVGSWLTASFFFNFIINTIMCLAALSSFYSSFFIPLDWEWMSALSTNGVGWQASALGRYVAQWARDAGTTKVMTTTIKAGRWCFWWNWIGKIDFCDGSNPATSYVLLSVRQIYVGKFDSDLPRWLYSGIMPNETNRP